MKKLTLFSAIFFHCADARDGRLGFYRSNDEVGNAQ